MCISTNKTTIGLESIGPIELEAIGYSSLVYNL